MGTGATRVTWEEGERTTHLIGTAHVSQASIDEVREAIRTLRPDTVCVELCEPRFQALTDENRWKNLDIFQVIRQGRTLFLLANLAVGAYQRRLGAALGVRPGAELLAAVETAREVGAEVVLVDRDIHITLKRVWANLGFGQKMNLLGAIGESLFEPRGEGTAMTAEEIENLKEPANLSAMMDDFARALPDVREPLIDERDRYMARKVHDAPGRTVVAVVGAAHVAGMRDVQPGTVDVAILERIPPKSPWARVLQWVIPLAVMLAFVHGYRNAETGTLEDMLWAWILPNSIAAGVLTLAAGGKFLSAVTAFIASPITSLNPLIGAGMIVGPVEAWLRKPTVADAERINDDVQTLAGFWKNRFTRVLVVTVASTIGSALGAWVGLGWIAALLGKG